jgi:hypothetical protein
VSDFYTYLWLRKDGMPYYVGKGKGDRAFVNTGHAVKHPPKDRILIQEFPCVEDALEAEKFLISYYGRKDLGTGCLRNRTDGGDGALNPSVETRRKISYSRAGKPASKEARYNMAKAQTGRKHSEETRRKMSEAARGNVNARGNKSALGYKHSEESRRIMSEASKKWWTARKAA